MNELDLLLETAAEMACMMIDDLMEDIDFEDVYIEDVIFNDPATIIKWSDGTKTVVKCQEGDTYDAEKGMALCICKKLCGNKGNYNEVFKSWIPKELQNTKSININNTNNVVYKDVLSALDDTLKIFEGDR